MPDCVRTRVRASGRACMHGIDGYIDWPDLLYSHNRTRARAKSTSAMRGADLGVGSGGLLARGCGAGRAGGTQGGPAHSRPLATLASDGSERGPDYS